MRVLFLYGGNDGKIPYVYDQGYALEDLGVRIIYFPIQGKGIQGYLKNLLPMRKVLNKEKINLIHSHYGYSGLLANLQRKIPVVTTFHGSDININKNRKFSRIASKLSRHSVFVSQDLQKKLNINSNYSVIPCGVDLNKFKANDNKPKGKSYKILFSSSFEREVKNYPLAKAAVDLLKEKCSRDIELIELKGYDRHEVSDLINLADVGLLTSFSEGSPQFVKELMACNCPCVVTNVGDIKWLFGDMPGYFLTNFETKDVANSLYKALLFSEKSRWTNGRMRIIDLGLDEKDIAKRLLDIYKSVLH